MKNLLSKISILALLGFCLSSCYYSSPVPLAKEGRGLEVGMKGSWEMNSEDGKESYVVTFYDQADREGYNGEIMHTSIDKNNQLVQEYDKLKVFITTVKGYMIFNIGVNAYEPDGEYFFANYKWDHDKLTLFYVNEEPFKTTTGEIEKFTSSKRLAQRFEELINHQDFFDKKEPMVMHKVQ